MTATDWIALAQAVFLAIAAWYAWRGFSVAAADRAREPRRRRLIDVADELKALMLTTAGQEMGRQQSRLLVALTLAAPATELPALYALAYHTFVMGSNFAGMVQAAADELEAALVAIER
jgi:hypothetical protein